MIVSRGGVSAGWDREKLTDWLTIRIIEYFVDGGVPSARPLWSLWEVEGETTWRIYSGELRSFGPHCLLRRADR